MTPKALVRIALALLPFALQAEDIPRPSVPDAIQAPAKEKILLVAHASGSQIYICDLADGAYSWKLKAPEAELRDSQGTGIGHHYAGPTWEHNDGSKVTGKVIARAGSLDPDSVPWLLVTVTGHSGIGAFLPITTIQRIHTKGGMPPADAECNASKQGTEIKSAYTADYYFYAPEPHEVEGRIKIELSTPEMTLAEPDKVPLDLHGFVPSSIVADWQSLDPDQMPAAESSVLPLQHEKDGSPYVTVVPVSVGKFRLSISVLFDDGGLDINSANVNVDRLPNRDPTRVLLTARIDYIGSLLKAGTFHFGLSPGEPNQIALTPVVFYPGFEHYFPLRPVPPSVAFSVITRKGQEASVAVDSRGQVTAAKPGQALVKVTVGDRSAYACADVMRDTQDFNQRSNCSDFLPPDLSEPIDEPMPMPKRAGGPS